MKLNGPQRIMKPESPQYRPNSVARHGETLLVPGNGLVDSDMSHTSYLRGKKRSRESEEIDPNVFEVEVKRSKTEDIHGGNVRTIYISAFLWTTFAFRCHVVDISHPPLSAPVRECLPL